VRLSNRGVLEARWEAVAANGRPPRHLYRLTAFGLEYAAEHAIRSPVAPSDRRLEPRSAS
jgi:DNA-binding PadR family transcriptional regulator